MLFVVIIRGLQKHIAYSLGKQKLSLQKCGKLQKVMSNVLKQKMKKLETNNRRDTDGRHHDVICGSKSGVVEFNNVEAASLQYIKV